MIEVNPIFAAVADHYGFTVTQNEEFNYYTIEDLRKGRDGSGFYWISKDTDGAFWDDLKKSFYDMGYDVAARW